MGGAAAGLSADCLVCIHRRMAAAGLGAAGLVSIHRRAATAGLIPIVKFAAAALVGLVRSPSLNSPWSLPLLPSLLCPLLPPACLQLPRPLPPSSPPLAAAYPCRPLVHDVIFRIRCVQELHRLHVHFFAVNDELATIRCWHGFHECFARMPWTRERKGMRLEQAVVLLPSPPPIC